MSQDRALKDRLTLSLRNAATLDQLERIVRYLHHARRTDKLTFSQYHDLLKVGDQSRAEFAAREKGVPNA
jgi:hypothetical protein